MKLVGTSEKILDGFASLIGAVALLAGLLCASAVGLFESAWLYQGRSFRSLVWALTDRAWLSGMAVALSLAFVLGLSTVAMARRGRRNPTPTSMAATALRFGRWCLASVGLAAALYGTLLAGRLTALVGWW